VRTRELSVKAWKVLRALVRAGGTAPAADLRKFAYFSRRRDAEVFGALLRAGLVEAGATPPRAAGEPDEPLLRQAYAITAGGRRAAEYGEFEG